MPTGSPHHETRYRSVVRSGSASSTLGKILFLILVLLNALPALLYKYYPTMDGAAHLYNARLIQELLFGPDNHAGLFFSFTSFPVPNWLGHFILALALTVLPAFLAEKFIVLLLLIGFPYAFRTLIRVVSPHNTLYSFLILPFCYSYLFTLGFYNFSLALLLMFITMAFWIRTAATSSTLRARLMLAVLLTLLYFAHIFIFEITLFMLGMHILFEALPYRPWKREGLGRAYRDLRPVVLGLIGAAALPIAMTGIYSWNMPKPPFMVFLSKHELLGGLYQVRPLISYNGLIEPPYTQAIFLTFCALLLAALFRYARTLRTPTTDREAPLTDRAQAYGTWYWAILCLILLGLYFVMPDQIGEPAYISIRLALLLFLFLIVALSRTRIPKWLAWPAVIFVLYNNFTLNSYYASVIKDQNKPVRNIELAASHLPAGAIVFALDHSGNWMGGHYPNYIGAMRPVVLVDNYEAQVGYFPLQWNEKEFPRLYLGDMPVRTMIRFRNPPDEEDPVRPIDHVMIIGDREKIEQDQDDPWVQATQAHYRPIHSNEDCTLYELLPAPSE